ncbi:MAG: RHS repeat-associated core domain-containing protein [Bacteroides caccae]|nr:RHS repeat-associated core domain-containing protein [Bacteroides caccae]
MFANGDSISYLYDAAGRKLRTVHVLEGDSVTTDYCGNVVYENGVPQILLTEVGYVSLTDGKYHYYLKDHQGNNRVVVDEEGTVEEVNHYYPFGGVFSSTGDAQPYDYGARMYDAALGRFMKTDRFSEKYVSLSPYQYGANNPVNNIDVNGDSITVLNYGYIRKQHMAILIQNDAGEWQYFSVNGDNVYVSGEFSGGRKFNDIAVGEFDSPQEFLNSPYNSYGASDDMSINTYGFSEGYMIPTSKEQDDIIRDTFISISKNESYDFLGNNCSTVVQKSLEAAGIITFTQKSTRHRIPSSHYLGESSFIATISTSRPVIPSVSFRAIIKNNPQGKMIYR